MHLKNTLSGFSSFFACSVRLSLVQFIQLHPLILSCSSTTCSPAYASISDSFSPLSSDLFVSPKIPKFFFLGLCQIHQKLFEFCCCRLSLCLTVGMLGDQKVMEKELVELFEAAKNAADAAASEDGGPADESRCLDALKELKEFPVNTKILVSTQVGKRLKHLAKHPRKKIQSFAIDLIEIWKNIVLKETQTQKKNADSSSNNSVRAEPVNAESSRRAIPVTIERASRSENVRVERVEADVSPRPQKLPKTETHAGMGTIENGNSLKIEGSSSAQPIKVERLVKQESNGPAAKRPAPKGPPKLTCMVKCNDAMRDKVRELLFEALSKVYSEADDSIRAEVEACDPIRVAVSVESVMFENWGRSNGTHKFKYRSIMFNIKDPNNPDFRRRVLLGEVKPDRICNLTAYEMASTQRKLENQQIEEKKLFDCERGGPPKATTDQFKCGRCGQRKCTYYQLQTRSADEPMTTFVTCVNCNNHWKFC